jgi:hypothetical protein
MFWEAHPVARADAAGKKKKVPRVFIANEHNYQHVAAAATADDDDDDGTSATRRLYILAYWCVSVMQIAATFPARVRVNVTFRARTIILFTKMIIEDGATVSRLASIVSLRFSPHVGIFDAIFLQLNVQNMYLYVLLGPTAKRCKV